MINSKYDLYSFQCNGYHSNNATTAPQSLFMLHPHVPSASFSSLSLTRIPPNQNPPIHVIPQLGCTTLLNTAGPGHVPVSPHPNPNTAAPITNFQSTSFHPFSGSTNFPLNKGGELNPRTWISIREGRIPKSITSIMEGSQTSKFGNERKERTFEGEDIWVMCRPRANSRPATNCVAREAALFKLPFPVVFVAVMLATKRGNS